MRDGDAGAVEPPDERQGFRHAAIFGDDRRFGAGVPQDVRRIHPHAGAGPPGARRVAARLHVGERHIVRAGQGVAVERPQLQQVDVAAVGVRTSRRSGCSWRQRPGSARRPCSRRSSSRRRPCRGCSRAPSSGGRAILHNRSRSRRRRCSCADRHPLVDLRLQGRERVIAGRRHRVRGRQAAQGAARRALASRSIDRGCDWS